MRTNLLYAPKTSSRRSWSRRALIVAAVFAVYLSSSRISDAVPINGSITFSGSVVFDLPPPGASSVVIWVTPVVTASSGSFLSVTPGTPGSFSAPYRFSPSTPVAPLWATGGFIFNLLNTTSLSQTTSLLVSTGSGILSGNGFTPTPGSWIFTATSFGNRGTNGSQTLFNFTGTVTASAIPEGGASSALLLGFGLVGAVAMQRVLKRDKRRTS